jgi:hypothetical protein
MAAAAVSIAAVALESLELFTMNPAGSAIVNAIGKIRRVVVPGIGHAADKRRYLMIASQVSGKPGAPVQRQAL